MLHFQHSEYLLGLFILPVLILLFIRIIRWKKKTAQKIGDPVLVKELTALYSPKKFLTKFVLFVSAVAVCVLALASLVRPDETQKINRKGTDIMIALDVSKSMLAQDIKPSRLERAKQLISRIIDNSPNDRIGLVVFAGRAYLQMPMTIDHAAAKMYLTTTSTDDVPTQGTVISEALKMCYSAFNPKDKTFKSILLISDGEDHDEEAVKVTKQMAQQGIMVNTVGIGSPQGAPILDRETGQLKIDANGETIITKLNEKELINIAKAGNGTYQLYENTDDVAKNIKNQMSNLSTETSFSEASFASFRQYFQYFLLVAFLLLSVEFFISDKRKVSLKKILPFLIFMVLGFTSFSQGVNKSIIKGNQAYQENKFDEAENQYREALKKNEHSPTAEYNLANTLYKKDKPEEAAQLYDNAIQNTSDKIIKQQAYYNKGVALQKAKKIPECIDAYKQALVLNPKDEDARQNLQRAIKEQQQQQQQDKKDNKENKDKKNQNKDKKQDQQNKDQEKKEPKKDQAKEDEPKQMPSKLSRQDAEEKLKSLLENEKNLQEKIQKRRAVAVPYTPEKDW